jgi:tetratricopeptide (TPR) repeat protein
MYRNLDRYRYSNPVRARKRRTRLIVAAAAALVVVALAVLGLVFLRPALARRAEARGEQADYAALWKQGLYGEVATAASRELERDPMSWRALVYFGLASYYRAYQEKALENKIPLLDQAIVALRRARLDPQATARGQVDQALGEAYYYKGRFYYDLTVKYIESALASGYADRNAYEYLGLAYGGLGDAARELASFQKAAETDPSDLLLLSIGKSYLKLGQRQEAEESLLRALNKTEDPNIEKESRFRLADIYRERGDLLKAEAEYHGIVAVDPDSAEAHFQLGELYSAMNDPVRARAEYRKTLSIDPTHYGARRRYYR